MVRDLSVKYSHVYVISGSIFDEDADGRRDEDRNVTRLAPRLLFYNDKLEKVRGWHQGHLYLLLSV